MTNALVFGLVAAALGPIGCAAPLHSEAKRASAMAAETESQRVAPYAVTPDHVVAEMLKLARVGPADYVVDLGSGDGRLVIAAVKDFGARGGFGVDISDALVAFANAKAAEAGVADRVRFLARDLFATDVSEASVVTVYLFPAAMARVRDKLWAELAPGTRVVSHDFPFPNWPVDRVATFEAPQKRDSVGRTDAVLLLYTVPERRAAR
jgi:SAM-dependent methyltransferase